MATIKIIASGKKAHASAKKGTLAADIVLDAGFFIERPCAGKGSCGKCKVIAKGWLNKPNLKEQNAISKKEFSRGYRLACQARVMGDAEIVLPREAVVTDKIFSGDYPVGKLSGPFGIAIDLGTTTVAAFLCTLSDGIIHKGNAVLNRQAVFGAEVISRMGSALGSKSGELKKLARASIEDAASGLGLNEKQVKEIERALVVGNSAMHHLLLGLPVHSLARLPFQPAEKNAPAGRIKLLGREVELWIPPLIGGFVGSDTLGCLIYLGFATKDKPMAAVDLGTNGEVMVSNGSEIVVASTAAGPAFEGVNIECGMRAGKGAIISAWKNRRGGLEFEVIGGGNPGGIAGSGLLSLVNLLRKQDGIDESGRLKRGRVELSDRVYLSQADIREVQKAKAAIRAAFDILLERAGLKADDLSELVLTGSFGARINVDDALELGMVPRVRKDRIKVFANAAGMGAGMMLSKESFAFAAALAPTVRHIELYADKEFMNKFLSNMRL